jgi:uncharacterized protein (TIGR00369 family)
VETRHVQIPPNCEVTLGMTCIDKSQPGKAVYRMAVAAQFANPVGVLQGGFLAAMADSAMGAATITHAKAAGRRVYTASIDMRVSFLAPARVGAVLECTAVVVQGGARVAFAEADIVDEAGVAVARACASYIYTEKSA